MSKLEKIHAKIQKEKKRIDMVKNAKGLCVDFMRNTIKESKQKIVALQIEFDSEYEFQNT